MKIKRKAFIILLAIFAISCGFSLWLLNMNGPGLSPDSVLYLDLAKNISEGKGFETPLDDSAGISLSPPLYPLLLSLFLRMGFADLSVARFLNACLFSATIFVIGLNFVGENNYKKLLIGLISLLLFASNKIVLFCFSMIWTEPLFVFMIVLIFYFLSKFIENSHLHCLLFSAIFASAAFLTRYAGITVIISCCIAIFVLCSRTFIYRICVVVFFLIVSLLPSLLWVFFALSYSDFLVISGEFHFPSLAHWRGIARTVLSVFLPEAILNWIKGQILIQMSLLFVFAAVFIWFLLMFFKKSNFFDRVTNTFNGLHLWLKVFFFFICVYPLFIFLSVLFFDFSTPFDERISLPFLSAFFVLFPFFLHDFLKNIRRGDYWFIFKCIFISIIGLFLLNSFIWGISFFYEGFGYSSLSWRKSQDWTRFLSDDKEPLYSNDKNAMYFVSGIVPLELPRKKLRYSDSKNPKYKYEISRLQEDLMANGGKLILFHGAIDFTFPSTRELETILPGAEKFEFSNGVVYIYQPVSKR